MRRDTMNWIDKTGLRKMARAIAGVKDNPHYPVLVADKLRIFRLDYIVLMFKSFETASKR